MQEKGETWHLQLALIDHVSNIWQRPDHGLWEVRGPPQHFTHSKVMAWVAVDRAVKSAEQFHLEGPLDQWRALRQTMHDEICREGFNTRLGCFVQAYGSSIVDASLLLMPQVGFLPATDPRVRATIEQIERHLLVDGFVLRYDSEATNDGLPAGEGAFLACSFWLADDYMLLGRHDDARALFERLLTLRNDVGLLSEEYDPRRRRQVGNFPQAFSHVGLIDTAFNLGRGADPSAPKPAEQRSEGKTQ
jgi:GH15 family glucan-1,4-alpha-glucosidase